MLTDVDRHALAATGLVLWLAGALARTLPLGDLTASITILRSVGPVGAGVFIVCYGGTRRRALMPLPVVVVVATEAFIGIGAASKTAFLVPFLALVVRWVIEGRRRLAKPLLSVGLAALAAFAIIQPLKGINTAEVYEQRYGGSVVAAQALSVLERFDGLTAIVDAQAVGSNAWLNAGEFSQRIVQYTVPGMDDGVTLGQRWTREVRTQTVPGQFADVSLAAGYGAEGYALWGPFGAVLWGAGGGALAAIVSKGFYSRRALLVVASSTFLFSTVLFELAILGAAQQLNRALLLGVLAWPMLQLFRAVARNQNRPHARSATGRMQRMARPPRRAEARRSALSRRPQYSVSTTEFSRQGSAK